MKWERRSLEEVADFYLGKMLDKRKNKGDLRPYLANLNVRWGEFELGNLREMRFKPEEFERYGLEYGDIVMCEGGEPGRCAIWKNQLPGMMFQKALHRIRPHACLDHRFLYYSFLNRGQANGFEQYCTGSTIKHLPRQNLAMVEVEIPPLPTQQRIAAILSAYDDLIENNTRRIAILEEMARRLYEEWFVRFRFPGHEMAEFDGELPRGWVMSTLGEAAANFDRKRKPLSKMQRAERSGPYPYYGAAKVFDYIDDYIFDGRYLLLAEDGSVATPEGFPVLQFVSGKFWPNNHTHILQGIGRFSTEFLYLALSCHPIMAYVTGAAQPKITQANMNRIPITAAPTAIHARFDELVVPFMRQVEKLEATNTNLRAQRDLLLPKLVSGEIDVSRAEAELEAAE